MFGPFVVRFLHWIHERGPGVLTFLLLDWGMRSATMLAIIVSLAGMVASSGVALPTVFRNRVVASLEQGDISQAGTFTARMALIREAWDMAGETTIVGLRVDQYRVVSAEKAPVHKMYLLACTEGGLLSLTGWLLVLCVPLAIALNTLPVDRNAAALVLAVLVPFLIFSNAAPHVYPRSWVVPLILAIGIAITRAPRPRVPDYSFQGSLGLGSIGPYEAHSASDAYTYGQVGTASIMSVESTIAGELP